MGPLSRWDFSDVFEEATFIAVPVVGFIVTSRRPGNRVGWIFLGTGLAPDRAAVLAAMAPGRVVHSRGVHAGCGRRGGTRLPGLGGPVHRAQ